MEKAVGYEQRRRIRAQIRIVKRDLEEKQSTVTKKSETSRTSATMSSVAPLSTSGTKSPTCSPTRDAKVSAAYPRFSLCKNKVGKSHYY